MKDYHPPHGAAHTALESKSWKANREFPLLNVKSSFLILPHLRAEMDRRSLRIRFRLLGVPLSTQVFFLMILVLWLPCYWTLFFIFYNDLEFPETSGFLKRHLFHVFVTSYWPGPSKHNTSDYVGWIRCLFRIFIGELYFYTTPQTWEILTNGTTPAPNIHSRFNYTEPWDLPCVSSLRSPYADQWLLDKEKADHNPRLYAIWNGKLCLVCEVSLMHPFATVFWIDSSSVREPQYNAIRFPNPARILSVVSPATRGAMIFAMFRRLSLERPGFFRVFRSNYVIGTFFGGDQTALREYSVGFWGIHDALLKYNQFVGVDQFLMSTYFVYADKAWFQPNYEGTCNSWFSTFSFYTNTTMCFKTVPTLLPHRAIFVQSSNWTFSLGPWVKSMSVPSRPFGP
jgi:hypothetical protein